MRKFPISNEVNDEKNYSPVRFQMAKLKLCLLKMPQKTNFSPFSVSLNSRTFLNFLLGMNNQYFAHIDIIQNAQIKNQKLSIVERSIIFSKSLHSIVVRTSMKFNNLKSLTKHTLF